jgi:general secretion pathway protein C
LVIECSLSIELPALFHRRGELQNQYEKRPFPRKLEIVAVAYLFFCALQLHCFDHNINAILFNPFFFWVYMLRPLQRYFLPANLLAFMILGIALGCLSATLLQQRLAPADVQATTLGFSKQKQPHKATLETYAGIVQRNIFDSTSQNTQLLTELSPARNVAAGARTEEKRAELHLIGTVVAGTDSLALIEINKKIELFRSGDMLPGGGALGLISRSLIEINNRDGTTWSLLLYQDGENQPAAPAAPTSSNGIRDMGENRWSIAREVADQARGNVGGLLTSVRLEPRLTNGATAGFVVRMIKPRSLLAQLGIRKGDVLMQVNGVDLNSPEKGLQVVQQLREARTISISLERKGAPTTFTYEVN